MADENVVTLPLHMLSFLAVKYLFLTGLIILFFYCSFMRDLWTDPITSL